MSSMLHNLTQFPQFLLREVKRTPGACLPVQVTALQKVPLPLCSRMLVAAAPRGLRGSYRVSAVCTGGVQLCTSCAASLCFGAAGGEEGAGARGKGWGEKWGALGRGEPRGRVPWQREERPRQEHPWEGVGPGAGYLGRWEERAGVGYLGRAGWGQGDGCLRGMWT